MRWVGFCILVYIVVLLQTTVGRLLTFSSESLGLLGPDLLAVVAVFLALRVRESSDVFLAAWVLGLAVDLSNVGGVGEATVVGPMSLAYLLAVAAVFRMREAFFRDRLTSQAVLALVFCLLAHGTWVTVQSLLAHGQVTWPTYAATMLQAVGLACYTAVMMPLGYRLLLKCERWFVAVQPGRTRRPRMVR